MSEAEEHPPRRSQSANSRQYDRGDRRGHRAQLPPSRSGGFERLLDPIVRLLVKLGPGDAYSDPWRDLAAYGPVETERFLAGFYYVSSVTKPEQTLSADQSELRDSGDPAPTVKSIPLRGFEPRFPD